MNASLRLRSGSSRARPARLSGHFSKGGKLLSPYLRQRVVLVHVNGLQQGAGAVNDGAVLVLRLALAQDDAHAGGGGVVVVDRQLLPAPRGITGTGSTHMHSC